MREKIYSKKLEDVFEKYDLEESSELYSVLFKDGARNYVCKDCYAKGNICVAIPNWTMGEVRDLYSDSSFYCECCDKNIITNRPMKKL